MPRIASLVLAAALIVPSRVAPQSPSSAPPAPRRKAEPSQPASRRALEVIEHVTVIDGTGALPIRDARVVVEDGRIRAVGPRAAIPVPNGATRIDGGGGTLLPGLIDMHAHVTLGPVQVDRSGQAPVMRALPDTAVAHRSLALLLANGVTTIRDPGGEGAVAVRDSVASGHIEGPRMFVAGAVIDRTPFPGLSTQVNTPDEVRAEVRRQVALGVDMVKLYAYLPPELIAAGVEEAHRQGVPAIAHVMFTTWTEAARLGLDGIVHIPGWAPRLLPAAQRAKYAAMMAGGSQFMFGWFELVDLEGAEMQQAINALASRRMHLDPTLVVFERAVRGDDTTVTRSPHLRDASPALLKNWRDFFSFSAGWSADDFRRARAAWPKALRLTRILYDRGVLLTAGTDANNPWTVPGESFHRELELLAEAGIPPVDVIRIATRNGAQALGILGEVGTIEPGKRADLVLVRGDVSRNISATRQVQWVARSGRRVVPAEVLRRAGLR
jgi:imidazolonepropionase-like amidohydrolase